MLPPTPSALTHALNLPEIRHIGIVVERLDKAIRHYAATFGLGPWFRPRFAAGENYLRGEQRLNTEYAIASAFAGKIEWQLIQVTGGERDTCLAYLERHGEGLHHVGVYVSDIERRLEGYQQAGIGVLQTGVLPGRGRLSSTSRYAYLDTAEIGGVVLELIQIDFLGTTIRPSRWGFELGSRLGMLEKVRL